MKKAAEICCDTREVEENQNLVLDLSFCGLTALNSRITNHCAIPLDHLGQSPAQGSARLRSRLSVPHLSVQQTPVPECHVPHLASGSLQQGPSLGLEPGDDASFNSVTFSHHPYRWDLISGSTAEDENLSFYGPVPAWICSYERQDMSANSRTGTVDCPRKP